MLHPMAVTLALALAFSSASVSRMARAADFESSEPAVRPVLTLVVVGAREGSAALERDALRSSLEASLGVQVRRGSTRETHEDLGTLSVMVSASRTTLLWTLPDGRSGVARLPTALAGRELHERIVATARSMLARLSEHGLPARRDGLERRRRAAGWFRKTHETLAGSVEDVGTVAVSDPGFTNMATGDFRLAASSPCLDKAGPLSVGAQDHPVRYQMAEPTELVARSTGSVADLGAFER